MANKVANQRANKMYGEISEDIKYDLVEAIMWARDTLRDHEGSGHDFHLHADKDGLLQCSFAKPSWSGDHCGSGMESASEAIVMAVCEYLNGV